MEGGTCESGMDGLGLGENEVATEVVMEGGAGVYGWKAEVAVGGDGRRVDARDRLRDGENGDDSGDRAKRAGMRLLAHPGQGVFRRGGTPGDLHLSSMWPEWPHHRQRMGSLDRCGDRRRGTRSKPMVEEGRGGRGVGVYIGVERRE